MRKSQPFTNTATAWRLKGENKISAKNIPFGFICIFVFFNTVIFTLRAVQNSKIWQGKKESLLAQQEYIIQQVVDDMSAVYQSRPLGIPYIISRYGSRHAARGILMWVANGDSVVYSSVENPADETLFTDFSEKRSIFRNGYKREKVFSGEISLDRGFSAV